MRRDHRGGEGLRGVARHERSADAEETPVAGFAQKRRIPIDRMGGEAQPPILHSIGIVQKRLVFFFDINGFDCFLIRINLFNKETDERDNTVLTKKKNWNSRIHLLTSI